MSWIHILILAVVQGLTELLPVSSSAHVIVIAELLHENMSTRANALLLVMLHTGTMLAVIVYFWRRWVREFLSSWEKFWRFVKLIFVASLFSGLVGYPTMKLVEAILSRPGHHVAIEALFHKLGWIAPALFIVGLLILYAGWREARQPATAQPMGRGIRWLDAVVMGILQGFAIPFRGFSRSGSTISGGLLTGGNRAEIESFSFAMVVAITPLAIGRELWRRLHGAHFPGGAAVHLSAALAPSLFGMACAFLAGLVALRWLSSWLERGRWHWFGIYCFVAASVVEVLHLRGW